MIQLTISGTNGVPFQGTFVNIRFTSQTGEPDTTTAFVAISFINKTIGIVEACAERADGCRIANWQTMFDGGIKQGSFWTRHAYEHIDVSADEVGTSIRWIRKERNFSGSHNLFSAWIQENLSICWCRPIRTLVITGVDAFINIYCKFKR